MPIYSAQSIAIYITKLTKFIVKIEIYYCVKCHNKVFYGKVPQNIKNVLPVPQRFRQA